MLWQLLPLLFSAIYAHTTCAVEEPISLCITLLTFMQVNAGKACENRIIKSHPKECIALYCA